MPPNPLPAHDTPTPLILPTPPASPWCSPDALTALTPCWSLHPCHLQFPLTPLLAPTPSNPCWPQCPNTPYPCWPSEPLHPLPSPKGPISPLHSLIDPIRTSTYKRPFTWEGNYLFSYVTPMPLTPPTLLLAPWRHLLRKSSTSGQLDIWSTFQSGWPVYLRVHLMPAASVIPASSMNGY